MQLDYAKLSRLPNFCVLRPLLNKGWCYPLEKTPTWMLYALSIEIEMNFGSFKWKVMWKINSEISEFWCVPTFDHGWKGAWWYISTGKEPMWKLFAVSKETHLVLGSCNYEVIYKIDEIYEYSR
jgi:hypothetical protein